jgi:hypothetical protein
LSEAEEGDTVGAADCKGLLLRRTNRPVSLHGGSGLPPAVSDLDKRRGMFAVLYAELMALQRELRFIAMSSLKVNPILLLDGLLPGNVSAAVGQAYKAAQVTVHVGILAMRNTEKLDEVFWNPIFALLRDQYAMATISTACCVIVTLVLLLGTLDVDMDEVQQSFDGLVSGAGDKHRRSEAKKERRSLYETFADTFGVSSKNAKPPTREVGHSLAFSHHRTQKTLSPVRPPSLTLTHSPCGSRPRRAGRRQAKSRSNPRALVG